MSRRPRILWLKSAIPWPLDQGTNFIAANLFRLLAPDYDIHYVALRAGPEDDARLEPLEKFVRVTALSRPNLKSPAHRALFALLLRLRRLAGYIAPESFYELPRAYRQFVRREMETGTYDLLFLHYWFLGGLGPWLADHPVAVLLHDDEVERLKLLAETLPPGRKKREHLRRARAAAEGHARLLERVRDVLFYTEHDADTFRNSLPPGSSPSRARLGVFPYFYPYRELPDGPAGGRGAVFHGKMSYLPNILAAERLANRIWPLVRAVEPGAVLRLAGGAPGPRVLRLAERPGVEVTGYVEDIRAEVRRADLYVAPITVGGGLKIKLMEAAELGRPLVATRFAVTGFGLVPGRDYRAAETDREFATAILDLWSASNERERLGTAFRTAVHRRFASPAVEGEIRDLFARLTGTGSSPP